MESNNNAEASSSRSPSLPRYECDRCGKSYLRKDHLARHAVNHDESTNFQCTVCGHGFKRIDLLERHTARGSCALRLSRRLARGIRPRMESTESVEGHLPAAALLEAQRPEQILTVAPDISLADTSDSASGPTLCPAPDKDDTIDYSSILQHILPTVDHSTSPTWDTQPWQANSFESLLQDLWPDVANVQPSTAPPAPAWNPVVIRTPPADPIWDPTPPRGPPPEDKPASQMEATLTVIINATMPELNWTSSFLSSALESYWRHVAPTFPFIHRGTFDLTSATPQLVVMMAVLGSRHMGIESSIDFSRIVRTIRGDLVKQCEFDMPVASLQAFCLAHIWDTWHGSTETQFVAQCMFPVMVSYTRKKGTGVQGHAEEEVDDEEAWGAWAKDEERRRAVFTVLLLDTQLSAFWNQHSSRQLSIFAHNMTLPCPRRQWEAPTAAEWLHARRSLLPSPISPRQTCSGYLPGLHPDFAVSTLTEGFSTSVHACLGNETVLPFQVDPDGYFGLELILIGVMACAWDFRTRGSMGLRASREINKQWRPMALNAIIKIRTAWEQCTSRSTPSPEAFSLRDTLGVSMISVLSDIPMLQVAAGVSTISGAVIGPRQFKDAQQRLRLWGATEDAWSCVWQSARYLRSALFADWGVYTPWAVYLATLVHWGYAWAQGNEDIPPPTFSPHSRATHLLDVVSTSPGRSDITKHGVNDLLLCAAERLVDGKINQECASVLWGLIGPNYKKRPYI